MTFSSKLTTEYRDIQITALTPNPAEYTSAIVANASIVPLINAGLPASQRMTIDGQIMAVAFMANAQHPFYPAVILEAAGVEVPTTYEKILAAAEAIRTAGLMDHPFVMKTKVGRNLGEEFINMYLGHGGTMFERENSEPLEQSEILGLLPL